MEEKRTDAVEMAAQENEKGKEEAGAEVNLIYLFVLSEFMESQEYTFLSTEEIETTDNRVITRRSKEELRAFAPELTPQALWDYQAYYHFFYANEETLRKRRLINMDHLYDSSKPDTTTTNLSRICAPHYGRDIRSFIKNVDWVDEVNDRWIDWERAGKPQRV